jgi:hypothetical protein
MIGFVGGRIDLDLLASKRKRGGIPGDRQSWSILSWFAGSERKLRLGQQRSRGGEQKIATMDFHGGTLTHRPFFLATLGGNFGGWRSHFAL